MALVAAGGPRGLGRPDGSEILVRFNVPPPIEWHARICLAHVGVSADYNHDYYVILTPDNDVYIEDLGQGSREIVQIRDRPADRSVPFGIAVGSVYDFAILPTSEAHLFTGVSSRQSLCVCPLLAKHVSEELAKESSILKERRKAREERGLAKPSKP